MRDSLNKSETFRSCLRISLNDFGKPARSIDTNGNQQQSSYH